MEYGEIPFIVSLDLRHNNLSDEIPQSGSLSTKGPLPSQETLISPRIILNPCTVNAAPVEEEGKRRPAVTIPILAAILMVVVLQWQLRRRRSDWEKKKDGEKEERRRGGEGEVYVAVNDEFMMELEELLRASAYVVGKSR
ncbi:hypothetical protein J5N97_017484 [Dioscorea zingiberensis]|uniref:Uncharacterized protein n=1 Tax=Dioscorea zingiberensis TaxID=325984 RepID=A0A9D5CMH9_9LILI|nr:hypothetical protein J5N97_017484 [Dioscorea zingiberensis]